MSLLLLLACSAGIEMAPDSGPQSGYFYVDLSTELPVDSVAVAGVPAIGLEPITGGVRFMVQGAPIDGPVDVSILSQGEEHVYRDAFTYLPPTVDGFESFVAIGASLTQGVQGGVPGPHGQLHSPSRQIAEVVGAYHPVPLLVPDLFPEIGPEHIGPAPMCEVPDVPGHLAQAATDMLLKLNDPVADRVDFALGRQDPTMLPYNLAVGDTNVRDLVLGPDPDELSQQFLAHLAYAPYGEVLDKVDASQLELAEEHAPSVVMITDTYGNDVIGAIVQHDDLDPDDITQLSEVEADLAALLQRLSDTGAQVFVSNLPQPTLLPLTSVRRAERLAAGEDAAEVDARIAEIDARSAQFDAKLAELAELHDNVHVVDLNARVQAFADEGMEVDGQQLAIRRFGGLLSTDGVHFSDTGYALIADTFITQMNTSMGLSIPPIDFAQVLAGDPHGPAMLAERGLPADCER